MARKKRRVAANKRDIPLLTDAVTDSAAELLDEQQLGELRAELSAQIHALTDELMGAATEQLSDLLHQELPVLIESILREKLAGARKPE